MRQLIAATLLALLANNAATACPPLSLLDRDLPVATEGASYAAPLPVLGGRAPLSFLLTEGLLPAGMTLDASGTLQGTPRGSGEYRITVFATDSCTPLPQRVSRHFRLQVAKPGEPITATSTRNLPPLKVRIDSTPSAPTVPVTAPFITLRHRLTATPAETAVLESPGLSFLVDDTVAASVAAPLNAILVNGSAEVTEAVNIPPAAIRSARNGSGKIVINRPFTGRGTTAGAVTSVQLQK